LIGYNLLLGAGITVRSGTIAFVKIGAVLALATSWPAYRTLVYDLVIDGPAQLVAEIGPQAGVLGSDGTLLQRLDLADRALAQLAILGPGNAPPSPDMQVPPPPFSGFDAFALGGSRILYLLTAIAALASVRIVAGLMLALGPFFIAFLLFDSTRSMFEGWVRVLGGAALATIGVSVALGLELALIEPWLSSVLARRMAGEALPTVAAELFVIASLFAIIVAALLYACARVARAFRLPPVLRLVPSAQERTAMATTSAAPNATGRSALVQKERSRAAAMASMLVAMDRRQGGYAYAGRWEVSGPVRTPAVSGSSKETAHHSTPVGRSFRRRPGSRVSASANRRDAGA
jgi:type IV secretion system protein VirB6